MTTEQVLGWVFLAFLAIWLADVAYLILHYGKL